MSAQRIHPLSEKVNRSQTMPEAENSTLGSPTISGRASKPLFHSTVHVHANSVVVKKHRHLSKAKPPKHHRGVITRFSPRSRSRMMRKTGQIRNLKNVYFVTLTYPGLFEHEPKRVKEHLFALKKRIRRVFNRAGMLWRLELKTRLTGASQGQIVPHFHLVLWGMNIYETEMQEWMTRCWWEIVRGTGRQAIMPTPDKMTQPELDHYLHGVEVELLSDFRAVLSYVSKYAAKVEDEESDNAWGRRWGICLHADLTPCLSIPLTWKEHCQLRRAIRIILEKRGSKYAWWLKQAYPQYGYSCLGLGDDDAAYENAVGRDIVRLIAMTKGYTD